MQHRFDRFMNGGGEIENLEYRVDQRTVTL